MPYRNAVVRAPFRSNETDLPPGVRYVPSLGINVGRVFSYNRVSLPSQARAGQGVMRQIQDSEAFCEEHGLELDTSLRLVDAGRSAYKGDHLRRGGDLSRLLELAEAGQLGSHPLLIIEALDRISRLTMFDALDRVLIPLFRSGVTILSLEDQEFYDQRSISEDGGMRMMRLIIRIEEANKHSRRLQHRMQRSWEIHRALLREGVIKRPRAFCPSWCDYSEETGYTFNEKVSGVQRAFELLKDHGYAATAKILNDEGHPPLRKDKRWTKSAVQSLVKHDQAYGAIRLQAQSEDRSFGACRALRPEEADLTKTPWYKRGELIEDFLPVAVSKEDVLAVRALAARRASTDVRVMRSCNTAMHWFGQRLTFCTCGHRVSNQANWVSGEQRKVRYLRCIARSKGQAFDCRQPGIRMEHVAAHVLVRLRRDQLALLLDSQQNNQDAEHLRQRIRNGEKELELALDRQENFTRNLARLMEDGGDAFLELLPRRDAIKQEITELQNQLADARVELLNLETPLDLRRANDALDDLRQALVNGESTPEQRCAVNNALWDLGITIHLDTGAKRVGLRVGPEGEIDWQPLLPDVAREALGWGLRQGQFETDAKGREFVIEG